MCLMTQLGAGKIKLNLAKSPSKMHQNQEGKNSQLVKKSFQKRRKSFKEMPALQFVILHEK